MKERKKPPNRADDEIEPETFRRMRDLARRLVRVPRSEAVAKKKRTKAKDKAPRPDLAPV